MVQAIQSLVLYKRHRPDCEVHRSRVPVKKRRFWMSCECPIWIVGKTPDGAFVPRQSTGFSDLKKAEAFRASLLSEYRDDPVQGDSLAACTSKYLASRENELGEKTYGQTKFLLERLQDYCAQRGVYNIRELSVDLLETFKVDGLAGLKSTSKGTSVAKLRCFLRAAFRRGWIGESLVDRVTPHRATYDQKQPYSDEEVQSILDESLKLKGGTHGYARRPQTFRLLLELMLETGMRVGDAILFDPKAVTKGERLWIYTYVQQKQRKAEKQKHVEAFLSDRLKAAIDDSEWLSPRLPFAFGSSKNPSYLASEVYERMQTIGSRWFWSRRMVLAPRS